LRPPCPPGDTLLFTRDFAPKTQSRHRDRSSTSHRAISTGLDELFGFSRNFSRFPPPGVTAVTIDR
jgi:hypothetical protein